MSQEYENVIKGKVKKGTRVQLVDNPLMLGSVVDGSPNFKKVVWEDGTTTIEPNHKLRLAASN